MKENTDNTVANPLLADVAEVEQINSFLDDEVKVEEDAAGDLPEPDEQLNSSDEGKHQAFRDIDEEIGEDESPEWGVSGDREIDAHAYEAVEKPIAKAIVEGADFLFQEILYRRVKIPEREYLMLETDPNTPPDLREAFRTAGFYQSVCETNASIKGMLGIEEDDKEELARLGSIIVEKHVGEVNIGAEGQFLMVLGKVGYQHYHIITNEIPSLKAQVQGKVDDGVERVRQMFESQKRRDSEA